jgi:Ser/Thr protein kinase RdoA (MazF antagonist)
VYKTMPALIPTDTFFIPRPARITAHFASRLRSADIGLETVRAALALYALELDGPPRNLPNARRNRNLVVHTQTGLKALKLYRADWQQETIAYEHSILTELASKNAPAPRLLATTKGDTWINLGGQTYCLFDFVSGFNYSWVFLFRPHRMRLMRAAGRTLARLHRQLQGFLPAGRHHLGFVSYEEDRLRNAAWVGQKIAELKYRSQLLKDTESQEHAWWLVQLSTRVLDDLTKLDETLREARLPRIIIHGDFGLHNLIFQDADHATPMDFELARLEWRLSDLVSCLSKLRDRHGSYDLESIAELISSYRQEFPIDEAEWRWFPLVWKYYKLMKFVQYWSSYFETNGPAHKLSLARDAAEQSTWLVEADPKVASALGLSMDSAREGAASLKSGMGRNK